MYKSIKLKKGRESVIDRKHPWIFSRALLPHSGDIPNHSVVRVETWNGDFLAMATYHRHNIALRLLSFSDQPIDKQYFIQRFSRARELRKSVGLPHSGTNCYRLIHGEGDGIPGLIIDIYNHTAVVQCHNLAIYHLIDSIKEALVHLYQEEISQVYLKSEKLNPQNDQKVKDEYLYKQSLPADPPGIVLENNHPFLIDWEGGQKTGFFLDQRDNRQLLASLASGKSVLNCFCYTGGFSIYALKGGASHVTSVDISEKAIAQLEKNLALNTSGGQGTTQNEVADVMNFLKNEEDHQWDIVIVDPPAFAKNISKKHNATMAYKRLNALALQKVKPGGLLFTFSCSQVVDRTLFYNTVTAAAIEVGRPAKVIHQLSQGADHPVNIFHPEGSYLKGLVLYVE